MDYRLTLDWVTWNWVAWQQRELSCWLKVTYFKRNLAIRTAHLRRLRHSFCLSTVSLSRQRHDILDFSCCLLSRVLHVTLANLQRFGFEFVISGHHHLHLVDDQSINRLLHFLLHTVQVETAVNGCNFWLSVWTLSCPCHVKLSTYYHSCIIVF